MTGRCRYQHAVMWGEAWQRNAGRLKGMVSNIHHLLTFLHCSNWCVVHSLLAAEVWGTDLDMNLYRSFGNLMEAWVNEDRTYFEPDMSGDNSEDPLAPPSDMGNNPRSESVDSGVETTSCYSPCPATSCSVSTDNTETDLFVLQSNETTLASTSQSSVLSSPGPCSSSSSSPRLGLSRAEEVSTALHQKVEQALQRTDAKHLMRSTEVLRRQPAGTFLLKQHTSDSVRCQRSDSCGPRRRVSSLVGIRQMSERRPLSVECEKLRSEVRYSWSQQFKIFAVEMVLQLNTVPWVSAKMFFLDSLRTTFLLVTHSLVYGLAKRQLVSELKDCNTHSQSGFQIQGKACHYPHRIFFLAHDLTPIHLWREAS